MATAFIGYNIAENDLNVKNYLENSVSGICLLFLREKNLAVEDKYIYEDLHLSSVQQRVRHETDGLGGVYLILNKSTLQYYIGSASTNRFYSRAYAHLINLKVKLGSKCVRDAVRTHGLCNFSFIILEVFPEVVTRENNKKLIDLEDFYLKSLLPDYNLLLEAGSSFGYKHTEITRIKMRAVYSEERRLKIGELNRGKTIYNETKEKLRKRAVARAPLTYSEEAIANMKRKSQSIILYNLNHTVYGEFLSLTEAAANIKCSIRTLRLALRGENKSKVIKKK